MYDLNGVRRSRMAWPSGLSCAFMTRLMSSIVWIPNTLHVPTARAAVPQIAIVPPHAKARPGVGSGKSLILFPAISTNVLSTMCCAALCSTPLRCLGVSDMRAAALSTLKMVVFSMPVFVPALHLFLPMLTRDPSVTELIRYGSPVHTPLMIWRVMKERSSCLRSRTSSAGADRRSWCANTCGSALAENERGAAAGIWSYLPEALSFFWDIAGGRTRSEVLGRVRESRERCA